MKDVVALLAAIAAIVALTIATVWATGHVSSDEPGWSRYFYLLGVFEGLGYAAAGWLWGREVHRAQVQSATQRVERAETQLDQKNREVVDARTAAARERQRVQSLAHDVEATMSNLTAEDREGIGGGLTDPARLQGELRRLAFVAAGYRQDRI